MCFQKTPNTLSNKELVKNCGLTWTSSSILQHTSQPAKMRHLHYLPPLSKFIHLFQLTISQRRSNNSVIKLVIFTSVGLGFRAYRVIPWLYKHFIAMRFLERIPTFHGCWSYLHFLRTFIHGIWEKQKNREKNRSRDGKHTATPDSAASRASSSLPKVWTVPSPEIVAPMSLKMACLPTTCWHEMLETSKQALMLIFPSSTHIRILCWMQGKVIINHKETQDRLSHGQSDFPEWQWNRQSSHASNWSDV